MAKKSFIIAMTFAEVLMIKIFVYFFSIAGLYCTLQASDSTEPRNRVIPIRKNIIEIPFDELGDAEREAVTHLTRRAYLHCYPIPAECNTLLKLSGCNPKNLRVLQAVLKRFELVDRHNIFTSNIRLKQ